MHTHPTKRKGEKINRTIPRFTLNDITEKRERESERKNKTPQ